MTYGFSLDVTNEPTGRTHTHVSTSKPEIEKANMALDVAIEQFSKSSAQLRNLLDFSVQKLQRVRNDDIQTYYRGVDEQTIQNYGLKKLGPNPNKNKHGRYHLRGQSALYLTNDHNRIPQEIGCVNYGYQEFKVDFELVRIADLRENAEMDNILTRAFSISESGNIGTGKKLEPEYTFSQFLASIIRENGWDALLVPGVHGDRENTYANLCIFEPRVEQWEQWVYGEVAYVFGA